MYNNLMSIKDILLKSQRGFTLIELLVVMVIITLLATLVGPRLLKNVGESKVKTARAQIEMFGQALDQYRLDNDRYPTTQEGLNSLIANPGIDNWDGPYLKKSVIPDDPWKRPYIYKSPGTHGDYDLSSFGLDGSEGGTKENKDINSWE
jgi:general secretion pathway protein G